jgi:7-cyano-7-deazaguanine synthase
MRTKALVLLSGGVDSAACAHFLKRKHDVEGLFIDYGQPALQYEREASSKTADAQGFQVISATVRIPVAVRAGEVQARNGLLVLLALSVCQAGTGLIAMGLHSGTPYYDCSPAFADRIDDLIQEYSMGKIRFFAPFITWRKNEIFEYCRVNGLDLSSTYSCESGTMPPCGRCLSCQDRAQLDACKNTEAEFKGWRHN